MKLKKVEALSDATYYESAGKVPYCSVSVRTVDDPTNKEFFFVKAFKEQARMLSAIKAQAVFHIGGKIGKEGDQEHFVASYIETSKRRTNIKELKIHMRQDEDCVKYAGKMVPRIELIMDIWGADKITERLRSEFSEVGKIFTSPVTRERYKLLKERLLQEGLARLGLEIVNGEVVIQQTTNNLPN